MIFSRSRKVCSAIFNMDTFIEQRVCIKFCVRNDISGANCLEMLERCYGDDTMARSKVYKWHKTFQEGREEVEDEHRSGRPSTSKTQENIEKVKELVLENRRLSIRHLVDITQISFGSIQSILKHSLGLTRVSSRLVPKSLNFLEKKRRLEVSKEMLEMGDDALKCIITGDETWIYAYDPETAQQSREYRAKDEPKPKIPRQSLTVFIDYRSVVHKEFLPTGQTVNKEYYLGVMKHLRESIRKKRPELWRNNSWFLHHDNAPSHTAIVIRQFLAKNQTNTVPQAPYSPDMAPCDFFLFSRLKKPLRGHRFDSIEEIKENSLKALKEISEHEYNRCFEDWKNRWNKCIVSGGEYFEGDEINLDE